MEFLTFKVNAYNFQFLREFGEDLSAGTAWSDWFNRIGSDHDSPEGPDPGADGGKDRGTLGTDGESIGNVFHVTPGENLTSCRFEGGTNMEFGVRSVRSCSDLPS